VLKTKMQVFCSSANICRWLWISDCLAGIAWGFSEKRS